MKYTGTTINTVDMNSMHHSQFNVDNNWDHLWVHLMHTDTAQTQEIKVGELIYWIIVLLILPTNLLRKPVRCKPENEVPHINVIQTHFSRSACMWLSDSWVPVCIDAKQCIVTTISYPPHSGWVKANMHFWHFIYRLGLKPIPFTSFFRNFSISL